MIAMQLFDEFHRLLRTTRPDIKTNREKANKSNEQTKNDCGFFLTKPEEIRKLSTQNHEWDCPERNMSSEEIDLLHVISLNEDKKKATPKGGWNFKIRRSL
jgi:hypothetical protein